MLYSTESIESIESRLLDNIFYLNFLAKNCYGFSGFFEIYDEENKYYLVEASNPYMEEIKITDSLFLEIRNYSENIKMMNLSEKSYRDLEFKGKRRKWK